MRKGFDGLYGMFRDKLGLEVRSGHLFLFANSRRNRLKILYWDGYATLAIMGRRGGGGAILLGTAKGERPSCSHNFAAVIPEA
jgi:transposase